ncbi:MAG: hypothetical protein L0Y71_10050, partial [Gemmataceae bacterium]|nr:hypothetical protein [Gemmataceae bacterium]
MNLIPGLDQRRAGGVGARQVIGAVGAQLDNQVPWRLFVTRIAADAATPVAAAGPPATAHLHDDVGDGRQR